MENRKNRITLDDTIQSAIMKLGENNPGAIKACTEIYKHGNATGGEMGGLSPLLSLDEAGIYGSKIYMLYNDVCDNDPEKANALIRASYSGKVSKDVLSYAIENRGRGIRGEVLDGIVEKERNLQSGFSNLSEVLKNNMAPVATMGTAQMPTDHTQGGKGKDIRADNSK